MIIKWILAIAVTMGTAFPIGKNPHKSSIPNTVTFCGTLVDKSEVDTLVRYVSLHESGNRQTVKSSSSTAYGYFQMTKTARRQIKRTMKKDSVYQVKVFLEYMEYIHKYIVYYNLDKYVGKTVKNKTITMEGLMMVGYVIGPFKLKKWLCSGFNRSYIPKNVPKAHMHVYKNFINWG